MPMLGDESELHRASLAKNAAAFFRMSRSARSLAFSLRSRSISSCSGFSWPWPGKACIGSALSSFAQRRSMFSSISRSRAACAPLTPRSRISPTASTLNSRANTRLPMGHLQLQQSPFLGVHKTRSRPEGDFLPRFVVDFHQDVSCSIATLLGFAPLRVGERARRISDSTRHPPAGHRRQPDAKGAAKWLTGPALAASDRVKLWLCEASGPSSAEGPRKGERNVHLFVEMSRLNAGG